MRHQHDNIHTYIYYFLIYFRQKFDMATVNSTYSLNTIS